MTSVTPVYNYADPTPRSMRTCRSAEANIAVTLHGRWRPPCHHCGIDLAELSYYNRADR
jgi:hypothetical protein